LKRVTDGQAQACRRKGEAQAPRKDEGRQGHDAQVPRRRRRSRAADELAVPVGTSPRTSSPGGRAYAGRERDAAFPGCDPCATPTRRRGGAELPGSCNPAATPGCRKSGRIADLWVGRAAPGADGLLRAQRRFDKIEECGPSSQSSPSGALVTEGRIVLAGAYADAGRLQLAIETLARRADDVKRVEEFHLRLWYALADLYERAGEIPRAREFFGRVSARDSSFADVAERLAALG
jgi:hypothetical protein